jgi:proteic killer suppression protein
VIKSFRGPTAELVFARRRAPRFPANLYRLAQRRLAILDAAAALRDLEVAPGNRLETLSGDRKGQYSMRINDKWRICFNWISGDAYDVEIVDYH